MSKCKRCLEYKAGRCRLGINGKCGDRITAVKCMRPAEMREDPVPREKFAKKWYEL